MVRESVLAFPTPHSPEHLWAELRGEGRPGAWWCGPLFLVLQGVDSYFRALRPMPGNCRHSPGEPREPAFPARMERIQARKAPD